MVWVDMDTIVLSHSTFLLYCGLLIIYRASGKDCKTDEISVAMMSCQEERETLSDASRDSDTAQLCQALQNYSECIGPKIVDCEGEALMAFNVIKQQYTATPYNCHLTDTWSEGSTGQSENEVNGQLYNRDDDQHMTNMLMDSIEGVTMSNLPNPREGAQNEQSTPNISSPSKADSEEDTTTAPNSSQSLHFNHSVPFYITVLLSLVIVKNM